RVLIAQLANDAFIVALHRLGYGINLLLHFFVIHHAGIRGGRIHFRSSRSWKIHRHCLLRLSYVVPNLLLVLGGHRASAHAERGQSIETAPPAAEIILAVRCHPTYRLDAEDAEVDRIAFGRHDAVFANDAVLLAAGNNLTGKE